MEELGDPHCHSMSGSIALYERFLKSFNVIEEDQEEIQQESDFGERMHTDFNALDNNYDADQSIVRNSVNKYRNRVLCDNYTIDETTQHCEVIDDNKSFIGSVQSAELCLNTLAEGSLSMEHSIITCENSYIDPTVSSEDTKSSYSIHASIHPKPVVITSLTTMENSNNAVDSVPLFNNTRPSETVFKLPITELSFNGALKHVQKFKPIEPLTVLSSVDREQMNTEEIEDESEKSSSRHSSSVADDKSSEFQSDEGTQSTGDSQYKEFHCKNSDEEDTCSKYSMDNSTSSIESFDSGVRSPDMFSDENDEEDEGSVDSVWEFIKKYEVEEMHLVKKMEEKVRGIPPPPSVTMFHTNVTEMLKKYYCFLPAFTNTPTEDSLTTPKKGVSFIKIPTEDEAQLPESLQEIADEIEIKNNSKGCKVKNPPERCEGVSDIIKMSTEVEAKESVWPDVLKCKFHDIHYNITSYSERVEQLIMKCNARFVGAETASSVTVYSDSLPSPSSAGKRKALRMKLSQGKSPGRRLSHLARRRQAFSRATMLSDKSQAGTSKMVLIDKNYFPHKKLTYTAEYKSSRLKRTPRRNTPGRKTPSKKTPAKTPKTRSGEGSRKKTRRLVTDSEPLSHSTKESFKRALFVSPDNCSKVPEASTASAPNVFKSRRALFGSPDKTAETKSLDGTPSDNFLKRKRDPTDNEDEIRSKIPKSLSFGGDTFGISHSQPMSRRASEMFAYGNAVQLNEVRKKKLLWAVSEALRIHGWRFGAPGFRERASSLAQLMRKLIALQPHAARVANPRHSTSATMLKLARQYVFAIIQGRTVNECYQEEKSKLANDTKVKVTGYISDAAYQQMKARQITTQAIVSQIKENTYVSILTRPDSQRSANMSVLQDKVNIDSNSSSDSVIDKTIDRSALFKSNSMPSFNDSAKMRARRQITFDNVDSSKRL